MRAAPFDDRGLTLGDGLFETLLAKQGSLVRFEAHAARLTRGCATLGLPAPDAAALRAAAEAAIDAAGLSGERAAVRLTWTAGSGGRGLERPATLEPRLFAAAALSPLPKGPASLALSSIRRNPSSPTSRLKTLAYLDNVLARREAVAGGTDEAVMLNAAGELACASAANLFWVDGGRLFTPALHCGVLDGTVRAEVLRVARRMGVIVVEAHEGPAVLGAAEAVFITNSLIGVRMAARYGETVYGSCRLADRLAAACVDIA